jgi:MerR family transcriptional regulator, copper efflux regulator
MKHYKIGELAKLTDNTIVTLRHYERLGLLGNVKRSPGGLRLYTESTISRVTFIISTKRVGFDLTEIKQLFSLQSKSVPSLRIKERTQAKILEIEQRIQTLTSIKKTLNTWEKACDGKMTMEACPILKNLYNNVL